MVHPYVNSAGERCLLLRSDVNHGGHELTEERLSQALVDLRARMLLNRIEPVEALLAQFLRECGVAEWRGRRRR